MEEIIENSFKASSISIYKHATQELKHVSLLPFCYTNEYSYI